MKARDHQEQGTTNNGVLFHILVAKPALGERGTVSNSRRAEGKVLDQME